MNSPKNIVIKVGTSTLTQGKGSLSKKHMLEVASQTAKLHDEGKRVVLVTSGSIFAGKEMLQQKIMEKSLPGKQMLSAVGQVRLMQIWTELFGCFGIAIGQLLLTKSDFSNRQRYLNVRNTLDALLDHRILPIINENDTVATQEIQFGDNDNLSALVANLIAADLLILLTDQEGLFTADPTTSPDAKLIPEVKKIDDTIFKLAGKTTKKMGFGTGGMYTKVEAAKLASKSGTPTVIASSKVPSVITSIIQGKKIGTYFHAETTPLESRKRWLLAEKPQGSLVVDQGAEDKLLLHGASLLPVGIVATTSQKKFSRGDIVTVISKTEKAIAVGIVNYPQHDIEAIKGKRSETIQDLIGYSYGPEVIHRDNMVLLAKER